MDKFKLVIEYEDGTTSTESDFKDEEDLVVTVNQLMDGRTQGIIGATGYVNGVATYEF